MRAYAYAYALGGVPFLACQACQACQVLIINKLSGTLQFKNVWSLTGIGVTACQAFFTYLYNMASIPSSGGRHSWQGAKPERVGSFSRDVDKRYNTQRWRKFSKNYLTRHPICVDCGKLSKVTDHITPVSQGGSFWGGPFQALCHSCHNRKSSSERNSCVGS